MNYIEISCIFLLPLVSFHRKNKVNVCVYVLYGICERIQRVISFVFFLFIITSWWIFCFFLAPRFIHIRYLWNALRGVCIVCVNVFMKTKPGKIFDFLHNTYIPMNIRAIFVCRLFSSLFLQQRKIARHRTYIFTFSHKP